MVKSAAPDFLLKICGAHLQPNFNPKYICAYAASNIQRRVHWEINGQVCCSWFLLKICGAHLQPNFNPKVYLRLCKEQHRKRKRSILFWNRIATVARWRLHNIHNMFHGYISVHMYIDIYSYIYCPFICIFFIHVPTDINQRCCTLLSISRGIIGM
jgi:hypothetical protein